MKILFCGGGTLGPVTPLLAVLRQMRRQDPYAQFAWVGTPNGPEAGLVEAEGVPFYSIPPVRLPRYLSVEWLKLPFRYVEARRMTREIIGHVHPDLIVTAGGYSGVPVIRYAAKEGVPCALHQLDYVTGLSNRAVAGLSSSVTTSFRYSSPPFGSSADSIQIETPCRFSSRTLPTTVDAKKFFGIDSSRPVIFVLGGGTGALAINEALTDVLDELLDHADVLHSTGKGKTVSHVERVGYRSFELMNEDQMLNAYAAADIVISRAGLGTLSELAALQKASVIIPIPNSHQEANARAVEKGIVWLHQTKMGFADALRQVALELLHDESRRKSLGFELHTLLPTDDGSALAERWLGLIDRSST